MPEFFLELFSEEIPARMQARAAEDLARLTAEALARCRLGPSAFSGPRRIALARRWHPRSPPAGPSSAGRAPTRRSRRSTASCANKAGPEQLRVEGDYWVLDKAAPSVPPRR